MAASRWNDLPHPTPEYFLSKKSGNPYAVARLFSIFVVIKYFPFEYQQIE